MNKQINIWLKKVDENREVIFVSDMNYSQFSIFRIIILTEIPVFAIDIVQVTNNDTNVSDEHICNRLGQIPLMVNDHQDYIRKELCDCETFCDKCSFVIAYDSLVTDERRFVMSDHISNLAVKNIPLINLVEGERLSFRCICTKSTALEHSKWNAGVVCSFEWKNNKVTVTLNNTGPLDLFFILKCSLTLLKKRLSADIIVQ